MNILGLGRQLLDPPRGRPYPACVRSIRPFSLKTVNWQKFTPRIVYHSVKEFCLHFWHGTREAPQDEKWHQSKGNRNCAPLPPCKQFGHDVRVAWGYMKIVIGGEELHGHRRIKFLALPLIWNSGEILHFPSFLFYWLCFLFLKIPLLAASPPPPQSDPSADIFFWASAMASHRHTKTLEFDESHRLFPRSFRPVHVDFFSCPKFSWL